MSVDNQTKSHVRTWQLVREHWQNIKSRNKRLVILASALLGLAFLWLVMLLPAINILRQAPDLHRNLDMQIQTMQGMQSEAKSLQNLPKMGLEEAKKALQDTVSKHFGRTDSLNISGNRVSLTLKNANPQSLAEFLAQARVNARTVPSEVKITRGTEPNAGWNGSMTLILPAK